MINQMKFGFFLLVLSFSFLSSTEADFYDLEHQALIDFYHSTEGPNWTRQDKWLSETTPHYQ